MVTVRTAGTTFTPYQGFYFIELFGNAANGNDASYWDKQPTGNGNYDRILVIENVYQIDLMEFPSIIKRGKICSPSWRR